MIIMGVIDNLLTNLTDGEIVYLSKRRIYEGKRRKVVCHIAYSTKLH